jgi:hypothetical protein
MISAAINLKEMTIEQKLEAIEYIWDDLCRNAEDIPSPEWHREELEKREKELLSGNSELIDWETAKKGLIDSIL